MATDSIHLNTRVDFIDRKKKKTQYDRQNILQQRVTLKKKKAYEVYK